MTGGRRLRAAACALLASAPILAVAPARGAETSVQVEVSPRRVAANEPVHVTIRVTGPGANDARVGPRPPKGKNLLPSGFFSTATQMSWVNGRFSTQREFSIDYLPAGVGKAQVPSFTVRLPDREVRTEPVAVTVVEARQRGARTRPEAGEAGREARVEVATRLERSRLYVGETVTLEYVLRFSGERVRGYDPDHLEPIPDFLIEDVPIDVRATRRVAEDETGLPWIEYVLFRRRLTPTRSGRLEIPAVPFTVELERRNRSFFSLGPFTEQVSCVAPARRLTVLPLPEGKPEDFSGAVGRFRLEARLDRSRTEVGQAANLEVTVRGRGSLAAASPPRIDAPNDVQLYKPISREAGPDGRTWSFPIVPRAPGTVRIASASFTVFDTGKGEYVRLEQGPFELTVTGGVAAGEEGPAAAPVRARGDDLRYIHPAPARIAIRRWAPSPLLLAGAALLPWLLAPLFVLGERTAVRFSHSEAGQRARLRRETERHLKRARRALARDAAEAAKELLLALQCWGEAALGEPIRPLERAVLRRRLASALGDERLATEFAGLIDRAEAARYGGAGDAAALLEETARLTRRSPR